MPEMAAERETLTLPEMAQRLGVGLPRVRRMLRDGQIPAVPVGKRYIVGRVAWDQWIARLGMEPREVTQ